MSPDLFTETAELYDVFYDWKDYAGEAEKVHRLIEARAAGARTLLDVACGTGRHLEHLRSWYEVEGLDIDERLLAVATKRLPGVAVHTGDMRNFDLRRRYDTVTCLFSSIGYVQTVEALRSSIVSMARHLEPGGVLLVEPWFSLETFDPNHLGRVLPVEQPDLIAVRMNDSRIEGRLSILNLHYLIARRSVPIEHIVETHALGLFTEDEYRSSFESAGLSADHDVEGLMGRGLWIGQAR